MNDRLSLTALEDYIRSIDAAGYAKTRNYLGGSTRLSEYITRGFISLPRVQELILERNSQSAAFKLLSELSWREYWQHTWRVRGDDIFEYFRPLPHEPRQGIPMAVLEAKTGIKALDEGIRQLRDTGYIDNHMRMWLAGLVCNIAKCDWKIGADWMHGYLIDGDLASNHLSWQWVAGSYTGRPYLPQQDNINKFSKTKQQGTYLDRDYADIDGMPVPDELQDMRGTFPQHDSVEIPATVDLKTVQAAESILLYSPWTLDPSWRRRDQSGLRLLVVPSDMYAAGAFSPNVIESIAYFAKQVDGLETIYLNDKDIAALSSEAVIRKDYPGIADWPGRVDRPELLHPDVPAKFFKSYSAYWKAIKKAG